MNRTVKSLGGFATLLVLSLGLALALKTPVVHAAPASVTWHGQIGPIVYRNCTSCHHEGGSGPFSLMTYAEGKRWGESMKTVTASRYMPPWLPEPGHGSFQDDRRISDDDISLIRAWVEGGMEEGSGPVPTAPVYGGEWQLGQPDLVLEMASTLDVPAGGSDLFMNFVLPAGLSVTKWVRAMEIKPGSPKLVHHANVILDRTESLRRAHPAEWQKGIPGMDILVDSGENFDPDSHFLFWKPDSTALVEPKGMPWRLDAGDDLVLNMHLKPTGKVEQVKARVGLYFTDQPATQHPMLLQLEHDDALDIPAGDANFIVEDTLKLPVAVDVLGVYPHAHYLGKQLEGWAELPGGERQSLVLIKDWDIDRQSVYRFKEAVALPRGSVIHMRYVYDNSAANVRNPHTPPVRVKAGNRSADEMGHLWLQVLPKPETKGGDGRPKLEQAWMENRLKKDPGDTVALYNLASLELMDGDATGAAGLYKKVLARRPDDVRAMTSAGSAMETAGDWRAAQVELQAAVAKDPSYADATYDLAELDLRHEAVAEAEGLFRGLVTAHAGDGGALAGLGSALLAEDKPADAKAEFLRALELVPNNFEALFGLGRVDLEEGDAHGALDVLSHAIKVKEDGEAEHLLALACAGLGENDKALAALEAWERLAPGEIDAHRALAQLYGGLGRGDEALREQRRVVEIAPENAGDWNDLAVMEMRAGDKTGARRDLNKAAKLDPANDAVQANLRRFGQD